MNITSIVNYILIAGVIQGFGFNLVTLFIKKKISKPIVFLNLMVFFLSLNILYYYFQDNIHLFDFSFFLRQIQIPWYMFVPAMFYAFFIHYLKLQNKFSDFVKITVIIFILEIILRLCLISYVYYEVPNRDPSLITTNAKVELILNNLFGIFLLTRVAFLVLGKRWIDNKVLDFDNLNWLKCFIRIGAIGFALWALAEGTCVIFGICWIWYFVPIYFVVLVYWTAYQGFYRYNIVQDRIFLRRSLASNQMLISSKGYWNPVQQHDEFFNEKHQKDFDKVKNHIIENKLYLNPLLSMEDIVGELGMSKSYFSRLVNAYSNNNFSDFVNSLRVEQAKKILSNDEFNNYTVVAIGLECGFNSKSTFYSAFKKFTSKTPTAFRAQD